MASFGVALDTKYEFIFVFGCRGARAGRMIEFGKAAQESEKRGPGRERKVRSEFSNLKLTLRLELISGRLSLKREIGKNPRNGTEEGSKNGVSSVLACSRKNVKVATCKEQVI